MFTDLLKFEWLFINKKIAFYALLLFYIAFGLMIGVAANFPFPNTFKNGTYILNYVIGIASLMCIFSTTLLAAQTLFREKEANFEAILYATPLRRVPYITSRFCIIFCISILCYLLFIAGLMAGQILRGNGNEEFGPFRLINYLHPFLLLLLPNILFCTAVGCAIGLFTKSKMLVYVSGVFIYFLYWGIAMFTNSPLIANSTPVTNASMQMSAILDPFGMAAFLEQSRYWTALQRNEQLLQLTGNLLINRTLYIAISALLLLVAYRKFKFTSSRDNKKGKQTAENNAQPVTHYKTVSTQTSTFSYSLKSLISLLKIEWRNIMHSTPIWLIITGWVGFSGIETISNIGGNSRIPSQFATTGVMIGGILSGLPIVALMVLLFYGNEIYWRSRNCGFVALENSTAVKSIVLLLAKWLSLTLIVILLIIASIIMGIAIQLMNGYPIINWELYLSLFYLIGLPLALNAGLIIGIQAILKNKYLGISIAGFVVFATNTSLGSIIGIRHPLLKFANTFQGEYSDMAGFGRGMIAFNYKMIYWSCIAIVFFILADAISNYKKNVLKIKWLSAKYVILLIFLVGAICSGIYIANETIIIKKDAMNDQRQAYESKYKFLKNKAQPTITDVNTTIDIYPFDESYAVSGIYTMVNRSATPVDTIYMCGNDEMTWGQWDTNKGRLVTIDTQHGYYVFKMDKPLLPGDSLKLNFSFKYKGSAFNAAAGFNTIINNGSFIRISRYFPMPGYNTNNEIEDKAERKRRHLPEVNNLLALNAPNDNQRNFINFNAIISTDAGQTAISIGKLKKSWKGGNRSYYQYSSSSPVPFRFAVASARYAVKKIKHNNTVIEAYFHPGHGQNIDHLIKTAAQSLDYCEKNFGAYPFKTARFIEISSFTKGFAGTAYPGSLFINEGFGYQSKIDDNPDKDILNEMVGHELSHIWWGNSKISPDTREGSLLMTETMAMYSELMIYKKVYGEKYLLNRVNVHKDIYLNARSSATEEPLYKLDPGKSHLAYDKGMVVMYQLYKLLGEEKINKALRGFYSRFSQPDVIPVSTDLLNAFYAVTSPAEDEKIDELFKGIFTYDILLNKAETKKNTYGSYSLTIGAEIKKHKEDGKGKDTLLAFTESINATVYFSNDKFETVALKPVQNKLDATLTYKQKPVRVVLDADGLFLNRSEETKEKKL
jgi:hypothetical protein